MTANDRIAQLGITLPAAVARDPYSCPVIVSGNIAFTSAIAPFHGDGTSIVGRVGRELNLEQAQAAARQAALTLLSTLRDSLGSLDRVRRVVKTQGFVNSTIDFDQQSLVMNAFSEVLSNVFGQTVCTPAHSVVASNALAQDVPLLVEVQLEVTPDE